MEKSSLPPRMLSELKELKQTLAKNSKNKVGSISLKIWANPALFLHTFVLFTAQFKHKLKEPMNVVLGVKTWDRRMIGVDISTEFWLPRVDYVLGVNIVHKFQSRLTTL